MSNAIKAIVCDFDGTFSTLRCGWEAVMKRMMLKYLPDEAWIDAFIGETTGVQTILQMKGFLEEVKRRGGSRDRGGRAAARPSRGGRAGARPSRRSVVLQERIQRHVDGIRRREARRGAGGQGVGDDLPRAGRDPVPAGAQDARREDLFRERHRPGGCAG